MTEMDQTGIRFSEIYPSFEQKSSIYSLPGPVRALPEYQELLAMGKKIIVPTLKQMQRDMTGTLWLTVLLTEISGENPGREHFEKVPNTEFMRFSPDKVIQAWIDWGKKQGLISERSQED